jgi:hypothetical protein
MLKLSRVLGITGSAAALLPCLYVIGECIYTFTLPDSAVHFETKGYASAQFIFSLIPAFIAAFGAAGALLARKKSRLGPALMIASGLLLFITMIPVSVTLGIWIEYVPPLILISAGMLALISRLNDTKAPGGPQNEGSENADG